MAQLWVKHRGPVAGPFTYAQVRGMAATGVVEKDDLLSRDGVHWTPAACVEGLCEPSPARPDTVVSTEPAAGFSGNSPKVRVPIDRTKASSLFKEAVERTRTAAEQGDLLACANLANWYWNGQWGGGEG